MTNRRQPRVSKRIIIALLLVIENLLLPLFVPNEIITIIVIVIIIVIIVIVIIIKKTILNWWNPFAPFSTIVFFFPFPFYILISGQLLTLSIFFLFRFCCSSYYI